MNKRQRASSEPDLRTPVRLTAAREANRTLWPAVGLSKLSNYVPPVRIRTRSAANGAANTDVSQ